MNLATCAKFSLLLGTSLLVVSCGGTAKESETTTGAPETTIRDTSTTQSSTVEAAPTEDLPTHLAAVVGAWETDFTKTIIDLDELKVGIPASDPRDAIRPIDDPQFETAVESDWIQDQEPGVLVSIDDDTRFYPLSILTRHEIVNDVVGDTSVAVTYCPLCNTAVAFDRSFEGRVLRLGVSGLLRNSDLVMWDDVTQTLWQQVTGEAIVGSNAGKSLTPIVTAIVRWADFRLANPRGLVLGPDQGFGSVYGFNPYEFYSSRDRPYGFFDGEVDERFPALERVVGVTLDGEERAYPFSLIEDVGVVNDTLGDHPVVVFWGAADTADALDSGVIANGAGVGTAIAYSPVVEEQILTFAPAGDVEFVDRETGSTWSILGRALDGALKGAQLDLLPHRNEFWFAWQAFFPEGEVWEG